MLLVGFFSWWYSAGWRGQVSRIGEAVVRTNDWFSIPLLLKTFFAPFRQISANEVGNDIGSNFRAWGDRMFSRCIGAFMRFFMIIFGTIALALVLVISLIRLILWPISPLLPIVGVILMLTIGTPWNLF
ncbi:MAG: hypothetical protein LBQ11_01095 [Candidatus Nomurabacteria bacterium]|jgi:uncharacterized membrane protein|nr:hypothetical protein [Candidatus Nomurabacteria bacterium]